MNKKEKSMDLCAEIGDIINSSFPIVKFDKKIAEEYVASLGDEIEVFKELGAFNGDCEAFYVANLFAIRTGLWEKADQSFMMRYFAKFRQLSAEDFLKNPYINSVKFTDKKSDNLFLTYATYEKGELFQYDMPDFKGTIVVPKIGFFNGKVTFPTIYEGKMPWMSVCPSETTTTDPYIDNAYGNVLILGLGLGYYPFRIASSDKVKKIVIVELNSGIIKLFKENLFPYFPNKEKFVFICKDAVEYLKTIDDEAYDYCFADIWEGVIDGLPLYRMIKKEELRLKKVKFDYWIEPQLLAYEQYINEVFE